MLTKYSLCQQLPNLIFSNAIDIWHSLFIIIGKAWSYMKFKAHMAKNFMGVHSFS